MADVVPLSPAARFTLPALPPRPPLPPQPLSKYAPTFQFPKTLIHPFVRPFVALADRSWFGPAALKRHVVICGFPRAGTTLCHLMVDVCARRIQTFGRERRALEAARCARKTRTYLVTKRPSDVFCIQELRDFYADRAADVRFILISRDPRAVLTSRHQLYPDQYYVSAARWRAIYAHWNWARTAPDVLPVRFEDLIRRPAEVERRMSDFIGWELRRPFAEFHLNVPRRFQTRALNGVRPVDPSTIDKWRDPEHASRLRALLRELPELPQRLIDMGYESDTRWLRSPGAGSGEKPDGQALRPTYV
jgi:hypothetical protein